MASVRTCALGLSAPCRSTRVQLSSGPALTLSCRTAVLGVVGGKSEIQNCDAYVTFRGSGGLRKHGRNPGLPRCLLGCDLVVCLVELSGPRRAQSARGLRVKAW